MDNKKIVLLDGGMGQELVRRCAAETSPLWGGQVLVDSPEVVQQLHEEYLNAGARVLTLNTYSVTPERLAYINLEDQFSVLQKKAFEIADRARENAGHADVSIAGCLPPLYGSYDPGKSPAFDVALATYRRVVEQQADSVDLFLCETMSAIEEAKASAVAAIESGKPVWVALSVDDACTGMLRSGETIAQAWHELSALNIDGLLLNCSLPEAIDAAWKHMESLPVPTGMYANGFTGVSDLPTGGGVEMLEARVDMGPDVYARFALKKVSQGADIIGGCCEISPAHIKALADQLTANGFQIFNRLYRCGLAECSSTMCHNYEAIPWISTHCLR